MCNFVSIEQLFSSLKSQDKLYLLLRHAERFHILPTSANNGAFVSLTESGRAQAKKVGTNIPIEKEVAYYSSPVGRCVDTAKCIALGRESVGGSSAFNINEEELLAHFFVKDFSFYQSVLNETFYQNICAWIENDNHPTFYPLHSRAKELKAFMFKKAQAQYNIFISHDSWVVPMLTHFCEVKFTPSCWVNFLTGIAFVICADGYESVVPVTGMDSGFLKF